MLIIKILGTILLLFITYLLIEIILIKTLKNKSRDRRFKYAMGLADRLLAYANMKVTVVNKDKLPKDTGYLIISNHQSLFDILVGYKLRIKCSYIGKIELQKIPLFGELFTLTESLFLDRDNIRQNVKIFSDAIKLIKKGKVVVIYPEGTRSKNGELLPFKPGSFKLAVKAKAPIVPITISGTRNFKKNYPRRTKVTLTVHDPISYELYSEWDQKTLVSNVEKTIEKAL